MLPRRARLEIEFPPSRLFPNRANGRHWGSLSNLRARYKNDAYVATLEALQNHWIVKPASEKIGLHLTFVPPIKRGPIPDDDNCEAAFKNARDGIASALRVNDKAFQVTKEVTERDPEYPHGTVIVSLTAANP